MSLKAFHFILITLSILLAFGFGVYSFKFYINESNLGYLFLGMISFLIGAGLIGYLFWYLNEMKKLK